MRHTLIAILLVTGLGCATTTTTTQPRTQTVTQTVTQSNVTTFVSAGEALNDPTSSAIRGAIATELGFPVLVVARVDLGANEQLVLYTMNALTHWLAMRNDRAELTAALEECRAEGEDEGGPNCIDLTLRDVRRPMLEGEFVGQCRRANDHLPPDAREDECQRQFETMVVFDVEAYCDGGFWAIARRTGDAWAVDDAGSVPETCLAHVLDVRTADFDADGVPEIMLDAVYAYFDAMRLLNEQESRKLTVFRRVSQAMQPAFETRLATYAVNIDAEDELRCVYTLEGDARPHIRRECCEQPIDEEEAEEGSTPRYAEGLGETCGPHSVETYAPLESNAPLRSP